MNLFIDNMKAIAFLLKKMKQHETYKDLPRSDKFLCNSILRKANKVVSGKENNGASKQGKLALNEKLCISEEKLDEILRDAVLKGPTLGTVHVMEKLKCDHLLAADLIVRYSTHECCEWNMKKINAFSVEFVACECLFSRTT